MLPAMHKPKSVEELEPYMRAHYAKPGNGLGGCFHIMTEDPNWDDDSALFCLSSAMTWCDRGADQEAVGLGIVLCCCSFTQRKKLANHSFYPS